MEESVLLLSIVPLRLFIHLCGISLIITLYYWKGSGSREFSFSYAAISLVVFALCFLLEQVELELGFALGLFAIFGIIRYRTITMPVKEMTYLFVVIGISVINALSNDSMGITGLVSCNLFLLLCLGVLETLMMKNYEHSILLRYEKIENLKAGRKEALIADLKERTGLGVSDFQIEDVDFLRDAAHLRVFYESKPKRREIEDAPAVADHLVFDD